MTSIGARRSIVERVQEVDCAELVEATLLIRHLSAALVLGAIGALSGPATPATACEGRAEAKQQVELFFGTSSKGRPIVSAAAWSRFLATEVTPRFPDGLTVYDAHGQWRGDGGRITREETHVLMIVYSASSTAECGIEAIRDAYKKRFHQELVMRLDKAACVAF